MACGSGQANENPGANERGSECRPVIRALQARGQYLAFLDSDDLWFPWTLSAYHKVVERQNSPSFIAGRPFRFACGEELGAVRNTPLRTEEFSDYLASSDEWRWWGVSSFVIRRDAYAAVVVSQAIVRMPKTPNQLCDLALHKDLFKFLRRKPLVIENIRPTPCMTLSGQSRVYGE